MITKKNIPYIIVISILLVGILIFSLVFFRDIKTEDKSSVLIWIYFKTASNTIEREEYPIQKQERKEMVSSVLGKFLEGPKNQNLHRTMPADLTIIESQLRSVSELTESVLMINFSKEYYNMTPIEEMLFRASLVWTMTGLDFINNVEILVENHELINSTGEPLSLQNRINIDINPVISSRKIVSRDVLLYFADVSGTKLLPENRTIDVNPDLPIEQFIVEHIILGPRQEGHFPTVSPNAKILRVQNQDGICFVNLSKEFISKSPSSPITDEVIVYSIVNSLTEISRVKKVQFLIESEKETQLLGEIDLSSPFERNNDIILDMNP